ncbi:MAG: hypothetical protein JWQ17_1428 [Tardiphaga sp.]|jgi:hypothetical protein|nr:hypothetical protein [Tardiphaga sp.]
MADDEDSYEIDARGQRVLIGLSAEETEEFIRLDAAISEAGPLLQITMDEWHNPQEHRWLELYEKHETARRPFMKSSKTRH